MPKMENFLHKTWLFGLFGFTTTGGTLLWSSYVEGFLKDVGVILTVLIGITTLYYLIRINKNRERREAIELARAETLLCEQCRSGRRVVKCSVPMEAWPQDCPLKTKLDKLNKIIAEATAIYKEETTKK